MDELAALGKGAIDNCNQEAIRIFVRAFHRLKRERLIQILIDTDGRYMGHKILSSGQVATADGRFRQIFELVIETGASAFALLHNHPSGVVWPSAADIRMTRHITHLSRILDVRFADHFIVAGRAALSMKRAGHL